LSVNSRNPDCSGASDGIVLTIPLRYGKKSGMKRTYHAVIQEHLEKYEQMIFLSGPRQVGKTTLALSLQNATESFLYLNWDDIEDRQRIFQGSSAILSGLKLNKLGQKKPIIVFDEIHKYTKWRNYLKGIYDHHKQDIQIIVTGSSRLNAYRRGGDSLMGRYFLYRIHPLSVGELLSTKLENEVIVKPAELSKDAYESLFKFGGFPEPFLKNESRFYNRWQDLRHQQLLKDDLREISEVQELAQLEVLSVLIAEQAGQLCNFSQFSKKVRVQDTTIRRWIKILEELYYCFKIKPWSRNVTRSLLKQPKLYLWDWSRVSDSGSRVENFVATHLHKAVDYWTDTGIGKYELFYLRDKDKREVDFLVSQNGVPWMLIEVKASSNESLSKSLHHFADQLNPKYTFQLAFDMPYMDFDIRKLTKPMIVPMSTFLSQLP